MSNIRGSTNTFEQKDSSLPALSKGASRTRSHKSSKESKATDHRGGSTKDAGTSVKSLDEKHHARHSNKRFKHSEDGLKSAKSLDDKNRSKNRNSKKDKHKKYKDDKIQDPNSLLVNNMTNMLPSRNSAYASDQRGDHSAEGNVNAISKKEMRKLKKEMRLRRNDQSTDILAKKKLRVKKVLPEDVAKEPIPVVVPIVTPESEPELVSTPAPEEVEIPVTPAPEKGIKFADEDDSPMIFNTVIASSESFDETSSFDMHSSSTTSSDEEGEGPLPNIVKQSSTPGFPAPKASPANYMTQLHKATMIRRQKTIKTEVAFQIASSSSSNGKF